MSNKSRSKPRKKRWRLDREDKLYLAFGAVALAAIWINSSRYRASYIDDQMRQIAADQAGS